ncbi:MAG: serine protease [Pseudomonadota bacterium]
MVLQVRIPALGLCLFALAGHPEPAAGQAAYEDNLRSAMQDMASAREQSGSRLDSARGSPRIVGGRVVLPDEFQNLGHVASLQFDGEHFCGASFVRPLFGDDPDGDVVLNGWGAGGGDAPLMAVTAAHCVYEADGRVVSTEFLTVRSESRQLSEAAATVQTVTEVVPHWAFDEDLNNDIAVLILDPPDVAPLGAASTLVPPSLPDADIYQRANTPMQVAGWGAFAEGGPISDDLRAVRVPFAVQNDCRTNHRRIGAEVNDGAFCAGFRTGGFDSCQGDSGGALTFQHRTPEGDAFGPPVLVGVVSWGVGCARYGLQGVYTDVLRHLDWLEAVALEFADQLDP